MTRRTPSPPTTQLHVEVRPGIWLHRERALYLERERTLVIADIHWGYAHSHRQRGNLLPLWGNAQTASRLQALLTQYAPQRMVWLGDSLHTADAALFAEEFLEKLGDSVETIILHGNHDRQWKRASLAEFRIGDYVLHHGDKPRLPDKGLTEIIGHIHPAFAWSDGAGGRLKVPILVEAAKRLILPAFSDWSSGATWNGQPGETLWLISPRRIFPLARLS